MITAVSDISIHMLTTSIDNNFNLKNYAQALGLAVFYCGLVSIVLLLSPLGPVPGGRLNKKDGLTRYGNSHVKDKTS